MTSPLRSDAPGAALSRRELEVAALVATGLTDQEIATRLYLSRRTAEGHVQAIRNKLGLDNRSQVAAWYTRRTAAPAPAPEGPSRPRSLPAPITTFFDRAAERTAIRQFLARARTVTIAGPAGAGKTRLALRVAEEVSGRYPEGACFADLAALSDPGAILHQVAAALGVREREGADGLEAIAARAGRGCLILLDNCEHLVEGAAAAAFSLLQASPHIAVLCTSREPLLFDGEVVWRLAPLPLPADDGAPPDALRRSVAVQLLCDRAALSQPGFELDAGNAGAVAQLCRRLDGIPLALELAAAQVGPLTLEGVLARLEERFDFLQRRAAPARHQTLDAALRWSYELLDDPARRLLRGLSIFRGGFGDGAAEAVCGPAAARLPELAAKSLVASGPGAGRWSMLETIRRFAAEARDGAGETPALAAVHAAFFLAAAESAEPELTGPGQGTALAALEADHDNLRAVQAAAEPEARLRLALALYRFWLLRGHLSEGRAALETAVAAAPGEGPLQARAQNALAGVAWRQGDYARARQCLEESIAAWRRLGDTARLQPCLANLGVVASSLGDFENARRHYAESLELATAAGERHAVAVLESNLGLAAAEAGDHAEARALLERSLAALRDLDDRAATGSTLVNLGLVHLLRSSLDDAQAAYAAALAILAEIGDTPDAASCLEGLGWVAALRGRPDSALRLAGAAAGIRETIGAPASPAAHARLQRWLPGARRALPDRGAAAWAAGRALSPAQAMALGRS